MTYRSKKSMKKLDRKWLTLKVKKPILRISQEWKIVLLLDEEQE